MPKLSAVLHEAILKNVDRSNATNGAAIMNVIVATANQRAHLRDGIISFQWESARGIGILVKDAGIRQHLANALDLPAAVSTHKTPFGTGESRQGRFFDIPVNIWNEEV